MSETNIPAVPEVPVILTTEQKVEKCYEEWREETKKCYEEWREATLRHITASKKTLDGEIEMYVEADIKGVEVMKRVIQRDIEKTRRQIDELELQLLYGETYGAIPRGNVKLSRTKNGNLQVRKLKTYTCSFN